MPLTGWALGLVSFVVLLGVLINKFREGPIVTSYVTLVDLDWKQIPKQAAYSVDRLFSAVFGHSIFSIRAVVIVTAISITINFAIYMTLRFPTSYKTFEENWEDFGFTYVFAGLLGLCAAGVANDICSFFATRVLLRRFINHSNLLYLFADMLIALLFLHLTIVSLNTVRTYVTLTAVVMRAWGRDFFEALPDTNGILALAREMIFSFDLIWQTLTHENLSYIFLSATSSLLPSWLYLASALLGVFAMVAGKSLARTGIRLLEKLDRQSGRSIVTTFEIIAILLVLIAVVSDL